MSKEVSPSIEVTIKEILPDGSTRHTSRWMHASPKGWSSADNLGREHLSHRDEVTARQAIAGWMRSHATRIAPATDDAAEDEDLIG